MAELGNIPRPQSLPVGISIWSRRTIASLPEDQKASFSHSLNKLGEISAKLQKLQSPITSSQKIIQNLNADVVFLYCTKEELVGLLRIGPKHLFCYDSSGHVKVKVWLVLAQTS